MLLTKTNAKASAIAAAVLLAAFATSGCQSGVSEDVSEEIVKSDPNEAFSVKEYGVPASPRVTNKRVVRKGGGRDQIGKPYKVRGKWYYPKEQPGYVKNGQASWYGSSFHGRLTANGEVYDMFGLSAAHPTFPLPSYARVTNLKTGSQVTVRVNDRGPYAHGRVMDLSSKAAEMLGYKTEGIGQVKVEYVGRAPIEGDDTKMLMATYRPGSTTRPIDDGLPTGVMIAMNEAAPQRLALASSLTTATSARLPGVRATPGAIARATDAIDTMDVGSIIDAAAAAVPETGAIVPVPTPRAMPQMVLASYAPERAPSGAVAALGALTSSETASGMLSDRLAGERIEIGIVDDAALLEAIRTIANGHGRLIVDASGTETASLASYAIETAPSEDVDKLLAELWQAGASDAFVLRD